MILITFFIFSPDELLNVALFHPELEEIEINSLPVVEILFANNLMTSTIIALIEKDPSLGTVDDCFKTLGDSTKLYRQISNDRGKPLMIQFIKTLKGKIPDDGFKNIMIQAWEHLAISDMITTPLYNYFVLNNLLSTLEIMEICFHHKPSLFKDDDFIEMVHLYIFGLDTDIDLELVMYWDQLYVFHHCLEDTAGDWGDYKEEFPRTYVRHFLGLENQNRDTLTVNQIDYLNYLEQLQVTDDESSIPPSVYSPAIQPSPVPVTTANVTSIKDVSNVKDPFLSLQVFLICGCSPNEIIKVEGKVAELSHFFKMSFERRGTPYAVACLDYEKMGLSPYLSTLVTTSSPRTFNPAIHIIDLRGEKATYQMVYYAINHLKMFLGLEHNPALEDLSWLDEEGLIVLVQFMQYLMIDSL